MSERLHQGVHPDADSLSAFVEGVLPEHERAECLGHLAECSRCREVVFLAQGTLVAPAAPVLVPAPARKWWFRPIPLLAAAAMVWVTLLGVWLYLRSGTRAPARNLVAQAPQASSSTPDNRVETPSPRPVVRKKIPLAPRRSQPEPKAEKPSPAPVTMPETARVAAVPPTAESASSSNQSTTQVSNPPAPKPPPLVVQTEVASAEVLSGISGVVTDPSGAAVPQATVQLRQIASNSTTNARTDSAGQFKFSSLAPGQYELQITAPGFRQTSQRVELRPQEVAAVKSELQIGSVAETVEVTAATPTLETSSAAMSATSRRKRAVPPEPRPLPTKLPAEIMVTRGKVILAVDSSGALFFSGNSGKGWKAVKSQWPGKVVRLLAPPELAHASKAAFQLTTDSGSIWLSRDGRRWYSAPHDR
jgi:hypothetical protein